MRTLSHYGKLKWDVSTASRIHCLAKFYLEVNDWREDKLKTFKSLKQKDHESFLFAVAIEGDGAPGLVCQF